MVLFLLTFLILPASAATNTCSFRDISVNAALLTRYATDSARLPAPKLFRTEANPEFDPDNPTTFWALPTAGNTIKVKVHHASMDPLSGSIGVVWIDTVLIIDPTSRTVSGTDECGVLHPATEHVLEILKVTQKPAAAN